jgi:hypothetical protein
VLIKILPVSAAFHRLRQRRRFNSEHKQNRTICQVAKISSARETVRESGGLPGANSYSRPDLVITCVDNARTRALVHRILRRKPSRYWLDCASDLAISAM